MHSVPEVYRDISNQGCREFILGKTWDTAKITGLDIRFDSDLLYDPIKSKTFGC